LEVRGLSQDNDYPDDFEVAIDAPSGKVPAADRIARLLRDFVDPCSALLRDKAASAERN